MITNLSGLHLVLAFPCLLHYSCAVKEQPGEQSSQGT
jgi:hypothetical protein